MDLKKTSWILAQSHRDDQVGRLARVWLETMSSQYQDLEKWMNERREGVILREAIDQANQEYQIAAADIRAGKRTPTFPRHFFRIGENDGRWEFHRNHPEIDTDTYLEVKKLNLSKWLSTRRLIYLDICHWINLRKILLQQNGIDERYRAVLDALRKAVSRNEICCPTSFPILEELMRQTDDATRLATADLMDELGAGVCLQHSQEIYRLEVNYHIGKSIFPNRVFSCRDWMWAKPMNMMGLSLPESADWDSATQKIIQKGTIDLFWDSRLSDIIEVIDDEDFPHRNYNQLVLALQTDAAYYRQHPESFERILEKEKALMFHTCGILEMIEEFGRYFHDRYPNECAAAANRPTTQRFDPNLLAALQISAGINATFVMNPDDVTPNDLVDAAHSALAIPYCDIFACDRSMAHRLKASPLKFDQVYDTRIVSNPQDLLKLVVSNN
jgi:hypothetical protein